MSRFALSWPNFRRKAATVGSDASTGQFDDPNSAVDHLDIGFSEPQAVTPPFSTQNSTTKLNTAALKSISAAPLQQAPPQQTFTIEHSNEITFGGKKPEVSGLTKPHSKVSPVTHMHQKLNFIPHGHRDQINTRFFATLPGVLKLAEVSIGFVAFILAISADRKATSSAWAEHITFETTVVVAALLLGYVVFPHLTLEDDRTRNGLVVVELLFYSFNAGAYFIAVWLMVHLSASWTAEGRGAAVMDAIACVALAVLYGIETFIKYKIWKAGGETTTHTNVQPSRIGHTNIAPAQSFGGPEHELRRDMESV